MRIKATIEQVQQIGFNAFKAAKPYGRGIDQYQKNSDLKPEDLLLQKDILTKLRLNLDYVEGRLVKVRISYLAGDEWHIDTTLPHPDYASWSITYPTYKALVNSVPGVQIIEE